MPSNSKATPDAHFMRMPGARIRDRPRGIRKNVKGASQYRNAVFVVAPASRSGIASGVGCVPVSGFPCASSVCFAPRWWMLFHRHSAERHGAHRGCTEDESKLGCQRRAASLTVAAREHYLANLILQHHFHVKSTSIPACRVASCVARSGALLEGRGSRALNL